MTVQRRTFETLVINMVGEPGCGKTTLSFWLSQALKRAGVVAEFVPEMVKYECFHEAGRARVVSGLFDNRYLKQQARLLTPLVGNVEVIINDGPFEIFYFYGRRRMTHQKAELFKQKVNTLIEGMPAESIFVMPEREHPYEIEGRNETEEEALALRRGILSCLSDDFNRQVRIITRNSERERLLEDIVALAKSRRLTSSDA